LSIGPTGELTLIKAYNTGANTDPADLAISPDGLNLYAVDAKSGALDAFTINGDGSLTRITGAAGTTGVHAGLVVQ
jgi:6-phosphogluconolactonase (cycloisomerase 2 family)